MFSSQRSGSAPDHELVSRIASGDERAFEELLNRYQAAVYRFSCTFLGDAAEAADVAQETFLRLYQAAFRLRAGASVKPYLMRIARNLCIDRVRRRKPLLMDPLPEQTTGETPHCALARKEAGNTLAKALQQLPENQRTAVSLRHDQGMAYSEIAAAMGTTVQAVESLLVRARKRLRKELDELYVSIHP